MDGADQATCDTALAADSDGTACADESTCTYLAACAAQPWAHCNVLNQKVTVNVVAPDDTVPDKTAPTATSGAATVGVTVALAIASMVY